MQIAAKAALPRRRRKARARRRNHPRLGHHKRGDQRVLLGAGQMLDAIEKGGSGLGAGQRCAQGGGDIGMTFDIKDNKGAVRARRPGANALGEQTFAGAARGQDQHRIVARCRLDDPGFDPQRGGRDAQERLAQHRARRRKRHQLFQKSPHVEGLGDVIAGAGLQEPHRLIDAALPGDEQKGRRCMGAAERGDSSSPVPSLSRMSQTTRSIGARGVRRAPRARRICLSQITSAPSRPRR